MGKKLYRVTVQREVDMYVYAEDDFEAEEVALEYADEEDDIGNDWSTIGLPREIESLKNVPQYDHSILPWGDDEEKSIAEHFGVEE